MFSIPGALPLSGNLIFKCFLKNGKEGIAESYARSLSKDGKNTLARREELGLTQPRGPLFPFGHLDRSQRCLEHDAGL